MDYDCSKLDSSSVSAKELVSNGREFFKKVRSTGKDMTNYKASIKLENYTVCLAESLIKEKDDTQNRDACNPPMNANYACSPEFVPYMTAAYTASSKTYTGTSQFLTESEYS